MRFILFACLALLDASGAYAAEWRLTRIDAPARVSGIETVNGQVRAYIGGLWYVVSRGKDGKVRVSYQDVMPWPKVPDGALPDSKLATGKKNIARVWLAKMTARYEHGTLGDKIEAAALEIETRYGKHEIVHLNSDAVFEDLQPRIADLDGDGHDEVVVVKSYLKRGSALAVVGERKGKYEILAETPPLGAPHRWLNPAGIADFTGDGKTDIALVRQPHTVGALEIWNMRGGELQKVAEMKDATNHIAGTRSLDMSAVADFDDDGIADIAVPSLDRSHLRIRSFALRPREIADIALPSLDRSRLRIRSLAPRPGEIADIALPAKALTNLGLIKGANSSVIVLALEDGSLVLIERTP
jgi:hypothetical protein